MKITYRLRRGSLGVKAAETFDAGSAVMSHTNPTTVVPPGRCDHADRSTARAGEGRSRGVAPLRAPRGSLTTLGTAFLLGLVSLLLSTEADATPYTKPPQTGPSLPPRTVVPLRPPRVVNPTRLRIPMRPPPNRPRFEVRQNAGPVYAVDFTPDSRLMFTAHDDGKVRVWDLDAGAISRQLSAHRGAVLALDVAADGRSLVSGGRDGTAIIWDVASGRRRLVLAGHEGAVRSVAFHPSGLYVATSGDDGTARVWDSASGDPALVEGGPNARITAVAWTVDSRFLVTGAADGTVRLLRVSESRTAIELRGHGGAITGLALTGDGRYLVSASEDATARLWDLTAGRQVRRFRGHQGAVTAVTLRGDAEQLVTVGKDGSARLWNLSSGREVRTYMGHKRTVWDDALSPDGRFLATAGQDGTVRIWQRGKGTELVRLVATTETWLAMNRDGQFDAVEGRFDDFQWVKDERVFGFERFAEAYFEPGLLARVFAGETIASPRGGAIEDGFAVPPAIRFDSPSADITVRSDRLKIKLALAKKGGAVGEVRLYHNGKLVGSSQRSRRKERGGELFLTYKVDLVSGENLFVATALSVDRIEGDRAAVRVYYGGEAEPATLHVLAIGINDYKNADMNLNYATPDAEAILRLFQGATRGPFDKVRLHRLYDKSATRSAILARLKKLSDSRPQDAVVLYFAGHGDVVDEDWYLLPYETTSFRRKEIRRKGISSSLLMENIQRMGAQSVFFLIDSCKSGTTVRTFGRFKVKKTLRNLARRLGVHVLAATEQQQNAVELPTLGHGLFTYVLLEGARGAADGGRDGGIEVSELVDYVADRVPAMMNQMATSMLQTPVAYNWGLDFKILSVKGPPPKSAAKAQ